MRLFACGTFALTAIFSVAFAASAWTQSIVPPDPAGAPVAHSQGSRPQLERRPRYLIQRSDTIEIGFPLSPEFNQTVTVEPDGYITLLGAGDIHVQGINLDQLRTAIGQAYVKAKILHDPVVNVSLKDFQKPYFIVAGQVERPGKYELRDDITVVQAVAIAGGFTSASKHSDVIVFHRVSKDWSQAKKINVKHLLSTDDLSEDIHLQPGDIVYVPQNRFSKFKNIVPYSTTMGLYPNPAL